MGIMAMNPAFCSVIVDLMAESSPGSHSSSLSTTTFWCHRPKISVPLALILTTVQCTSLTAITSGLFHYAAPSYILVS